MQKMSEKEALQDIQFLARRYNDLDQLNYSVKQESLDMAINAIEEIQQYRAIDTVEECREAVERMKPKKPVKVHDMEDLAHTCFIECPCGAMNHTDIKHKVIYCWKCGNLLDWSE